MTNSFKTYYVSQIDGNDTNDGLSKSSAFATLFAINRLTLKPGDRVLLARGSVFEGQFLPVRSKTVEQKNLRLRLVHICQRAARNFMRKYCR